jgi:MSHA biogenesis protein MshJ
MKQAWKNLSTRIDALSLRERAILFVVLIGGLMALVNTLLLAPAQQVHQQLKGRFDLQSAELKRLRGEFTGQPQQLDASQPLRDELAALRLRLDEIDRSIQAVQPAYEPVPLSQILVPLLRRHEGLKLVRTAALAMAPPAAKPEATAVPAIPAPAPGLPGAMANANLLLAQANTQGQPVVPAPTVMGVTRQGVELTVAGPYAQMISYVQSLESALPQVRWGAMVLRSEKSPPELTLQLFLVGLQQ